MASAIFRRSRPWGGNSSGVATLSHSSCVICHVSVPCSTLVISPATRHRSGLVGPLPVRHRPRPMRYSADTCYADPQFVRGRAWAWRRLLTALDVDLMVFDHAPTALMASEGLGMARVLYGSTFCAPPQTDPLPHMQWWERRGAENIQANEKLALHTLNTLRREMGNRERDKVASLFATEANFLLGIEALDHYPQRSGVTYHGPAPAPPTRARRVENRMASPG
jgi:hypothetical protein